MSSTIRSRGVRVRNRFPTERAAVQVPQTHLEVDAPVVKQLLFREGTSIAKRCSRRRKKRRRDVNYRAGSSSRSVRAGLRERVAGEGHDWQGTPRYSRHAHFFSVYRNFSSFFFTPSQSAVQPDRRAGATSETSNAGVDARRVCS